MKTFGFIIFLLIYMILASIVGGFVFVKLWDWFIVTTFAVKSLTIGQAIGLAFFIGYIKTDLNKDKKIESSDSVDKNALITKIFLTIGEVFSYYALILLFGWILHLIIG